jgi:cytochrome c-type biogenesis protein CcmH/NrfG
MKRVVIFVLFVSLMTACSSCGHNESNSQANANVSPENPFSYITDAHEALAEGNRLLDEDQTEQAILALKQAVSLDPDLADAWFQLGIAYALYERQLERSGESTEPESNSKERVKPSSERAFEKAAEAYKKWIAAHPDDDAALFNLGRTYSKLLKDEAAEDAFKKAVKLKPDDSEYQTELGAVLIKLARYHEAIDPLKKAIALDDQNIRAQELLDDAEAGRQRLDYVSPKNTNTTNANLSNANISTNSNSNSNSNTAHRPANANLRPIKEETKRPAHSVNQPDQ